jgi:thiol:disulfide interchange protein
MSDTPKPGRWIHQVVAAAVALVLVAAGARLVWSLLAPLVPLLLVGLTLYAVYAVIFRRHK